MNINCLKVGDVVTSKWFAYGRWSREKDEIFVMKEKVKSYPASEEVPEEERIKQALKTGKYPPKVRRIQRSAYDATRSKAKFVVLQTSVVYQGLDQVEAMGVSAKRLSNGKYYIEGEIIRFDIQATSKPGPKLFKVGKDIKVVGEMKKMEIFV